MVVFVLFVFLVNVTYAKNYNPLKEKTIIIDPGHGGPDPGTIYKDILEKNVNLSISKELKKELSKYGVNVIMTRDGDYDLSSPGAIYRKKSDFDNRLTLINIEKADLYLSIHLNYLNDSSYYGPQVFYLNDDKDLAIITQKELNKISDSNRNVKLIPNDTYMYKRINISGLLIECGFLSNSYDRNRLVDNKYQSKIVEAIIRGLQLYFTQYSH